MPAVKRFFVWGNHYLLGLREIDEQHEDLAIKLNLLFEAYRAGESEARLGKRLEEIAAAALLHFRREEAIMEAADYEGLALHKAEHDFLANHLLAFIDEHQAGRTKVTDSVLSYLKDWLRDHLLIADKRLGTYLRGRVRRRQ